MATGNLILITAAVLAGTGLSVHGYLEGGEAACAAPTAAEHRVETSYGSALLPLVEIPASTMSSITSKKVHKTQRNKSVCEVLVTKSTRKVPAGKCPASRNADASESPTSAQPKRGPATIGM